MNIPTEFDKELEQIRIAYISDYEKAWRDYSNNLIGPAALDTGLTVLAREHDKSIKQAVDKYVISTVEEWSQKTGHYPIEEEIRYELAAEQRQSLWGDK